MVLNGSLSSVFSSYVHDMFTTSLSSWFGLQDQERERQDQQMAARGDCRCCPHCGKVIEKNAGSLAEICLTLERFSANSLGCLIRSVIFFDRFAVQLLKGCR